MIVQLVVTGLALGSMYGLVALGYHITWATSRTMNFSQGHTVVAGAVALLRLREQGGGGGELAGMGSMGGMEAGGGAETGGGAGGSPCAAADCYAGPRKTDSSWRPSASSVPTSPPVVMLMMV